MEMYACDVTEYETAATKRMVSYLSNYGLYTELVTIPLFLFGWWSFKSSHSMLYLPPHLKYQASDS